MNLKITLQTLRRIERLLDGWQSSGDIPAIERDLACDLLRRAYDDIFFSDRDAATAPEASLAENTPADRTNEKAVGEVPDTVAGTTAAADDALVADVASPVGLVGFAPSEAAEESSEESPENTEAVAEPAAEPAPMEVPAEVPAEEDASAEMPVDASVSVEESVEEPAAVGEPVEEDHPVAMPVGEVAEEEIPVEEFGAAGELGDAVEQSGEAGETGDAVEESDDTVPSAEDVATSIPEPSVDIVIDPVFEVFTDEDKDAEEPDGTEKTEEAAAVVNLAETMNVVDAVEAVGAAEDTEIAEDMEEMEVVEEMDAEEPEIGHPAAAPAAPAAEPGPESVSASAPAESSTEETRTDAAASTAETLEEMAARFKNASGRRRKSRRAFLSLYDDDETFRRGAPNDQLELSDWGIEPSDTSAKLRHTRELFGLPADDPDTTPEPTPQPAADAAVDANVNAADGEVEVEVFDFVGDDDLEQSDQTAEPAAESPVKPATEPTSEPMSEPASEPTSEPMSEPASEPTSEPMSEPASEPSAVPIEPASRPTAAPAREERDDADDDLPFDEAIVALDDPDDASDSDDAPSVLPSLEPLGSPEHSEHSEFPDAVPFDSIEIADPAASATEPAAVRGLYDRGEEPELPASTTVLGEVMGHDVPTVGDSLGRRPDVAGWAEVSDDLNRAISVGDRFVLLRDLFDGDQALCDRTLKRLSTFDDLDDCMIWITENFAWNANSEGAKLIMGLLERKLG